MARNQTGSCLTSPSSVLQRNPRVGFASSLFILRRNSPLNSKRLHWNNNRQHTSKQMCRHRARLLERENSTSRNKAGSLGMEKTSQVTYRRGRKAASQFRLSVKTWRTKQNVKVVLTFRLTGVTQKLFTEATLRRLGRRSTDKITFARFTNVN